jgi:hypothetical protein
MKLHPSQHCPCHEPQRVYVMIWCVTRSRSVYTRKSHASLLHYGYAVNRSLAWSLDIGLLVSVSSVRPRHPNGRASTAAPRPHKSPPPRSALPTTAQVPTTSLCQPHHHASRCRLALPAPSPHRSPPPRPARPTTVQVAATSLCPILNYVLEYYGRSTYHPRGTSVQVAQPDLDARPQFFK